MNILKTELSYRISGQGLAVIGRQVGMMCGMY